MFQISWPWTIVSSSVIVWDFFFFFWTWRIGEEDNNENDVNNLIKSTYESRDSFFVKKLTQFINLYRIAKIFELREANAKNQRLKGKLPYPVKVKDTNAKNS